MKSKRKSGRAKLCFYPMTPRGLAIFGAGFGKCYFSLLIQLLTDLAFLLSREVAGHR